MPSYDPSLFNTNPYYDDYNEDKKFLRMLFRPGYSVQARELTQLQTILQNQIERFGNHVFRDGSRIIGGEISTQTLDFVRLNPSTTSPSFQLAEGDLVGYNLIQKDALGATYAQARVVDFLPSTSADPYAIVVVSYLSGSGFSAGATLECSNTNKTINAQIAPSTATATGRCKVVGVNEGIYYINGFFVKTDDQFEPAYTLDSSGIRTFTDPTGIMGFDVISEVVTEGEDYTLKDPASGSYNYNAPGAHRYRITLTLKFLEATVGQNFIELVKYEGGTITKKYESTQYSELLKLFAQRTYDESGNYIVRPFDISFRNGSGSTFHADIGSGKAYVFGYEYETKFKDTIDIPTARSTKTYSDYSIANYYGNYIKGKYGTDGDNLNPIFYSIAIGKDSKGHLVYGSTAPVSSGDLSSVAFSANLIGIRNIDTLTSNQGGTMDFAIHLTNISYVSSVQAESKINLYHLDPSTNLTTKLFSDIELASISGVTNAKVYDSTDASLVYQLNGATPTTLVKNVSKTQYIYDAYRGFNATAVSRMPQVSLSRGVDFNWCKGNGFVPTGSPVEIQKNDGYYLVYASGTAIPVGTIIKIVGVAETVSSTETKVTAQITGDGDYVKFTSELPVGSYYLVGKSKNVSTGMAASGIDLTAKIRTKTSASATETFANGLATLASFKRVIKRNAADAVYELYFVLDKPDVLKIDSILQGTTDISSRFLFDNGQRDSTYELARLYVKPEWFAQYSGSFQSFTVAYTYFEHSGYGPFTVESYRGISYQDIPVFTSVRTGKSISLTNAMDFRHVAQIDGFVPSGATAGTITSSLASASSNRPIISYYNGFSPDQFTLLNSNDAYLPRIDKLVIAKNISEDPSLHLVSGVASDSPLVPEDLSDSMTLFVLSIPPYTFNARDVKAEYIGNSRFTMKDIGGVSKRVDNLEQYASLNELELSVVSKNITTSSGDVAIKKAIMVDSFEGHSVGDVSDRDYRCSIDMERGELRPSFSSEAYDFTYDAVAGLTLTSDNILCYSYTKHTPPIISQDKASTTIKVNPFDLPNWIGNISIRPHADYWYDNDIRPLVKINDNGVNDAWVVSEMNGAFGHGSQWNDWESIWDGLSVELNDAESQKNASFFSRPKGSFLGSVSPKFTTLDGVERTTETLSAKKNSYIPDFKKKNYYVEPVANTILNKSVSPYIRGGRTITFSAYNLKPKTQVHVFFDNVNVNQYCVQNGATGPFTTSTESGSLANVTFTIPSNTFEIGEKILRIVDDANNDIENATTLAEISYYVSGIKEEDYLGASSIRPMEARKQSPNSNRIVSNPLFREKSINTASFTQWIDPLAQTFEVSQTFYPDGFFLDSVDLFFSSKDDSLPVTVEIHPVVNGIPHPSLVIPFSTVVASPSSVNANQETPTATNFKFSSPVYLEPGEYAIVVKANTSRYSLFAGTIGEFDLVDNERISSTLPTGTLFKPQNGSDRTGDSSMDIMFNLNRCQFSGAATITLKNKHSGTQDDSNADLIQPNVFVFAPSGVSVSTQVKVGSSVYSTTPSRNLELSERFFIDAAGDLEIILTPFVTRAGFLTPMVDMDRTNIVTVENIIDSSESNTDELTSVPGNTNGKTARYITRKVALPVGETADELKVILDANIPTGSFIRVYAKVINSQSINLGLDGTNYQQLTEIPGGFTVGGNTTTSLNGFDFREVMYSLTPSTQFDTFVVKICMYSTDSTSVPSLKNLRVVAVE